MPSYSLLTAGESSPKLAKGEGLGIESAILHLSPSDFAIPGKNVCPWASKGCAGEWKADSLGRLRRVGGACLTLSGRGQIRGVVTPRKLEAHGIHRARNRRTRMFLQDREAFLRELHSDLLALKRAAARADSKPAVRLNGTSDIRWEAFGVIDAHPDIQAFDYTKGLDRYRAWLRGELPDNYHLTFSASEDSSPETLRELLGAGGTVAMVFDALPDSWGGFPVIDATTHDFRFLDAPGSVAGLTPKGKRGRDDASGFVRRN